MRKYFTKIRSQGLNSYLSQLIFCSILFLTFSSSFAQQHIALLVFDDVRLVTTEGFYSGMNELGYTDVVYEVYNAGGNRDTLPALAEAITFSHPDLAVAAGGIEADALKLATESTHIPVLFLAVSSSLGRGLVQSMAVPEGNLTGIDTWDTELTGKRLEFISVILPEAGRVLLLNVPSIAASVAALSLARSVAPELGLELLVEDVETPEDIQGVADRLENIQADVLLFLPAAPIWNNSRNILFPACIQNGVPIFGMNADDLLRGACFSYAGTRYQAGFQAARLARKILSGEDPAFIPVETPRNPQLALNITTILMYDSLSIDSIAWDLADTVLTFEVTPAEGN